MATTNVTATVCVDGVLQRVAAGLHYEIHGDPDLVDWDDRATLAIQACHRSVLTVPSRDVARVERSIDATDRWWEDWRRTRDLDQREDAPTVN